MQVTLRCFVRLVAIGAVILCAGAGRADEVAGQWRGVSRIRGTISIEHHEWVHESRIREGEESDKREAAEIQFVMVVDRDHNTPSMVWRAESASITGSIHGSTAFHINRNLGPSTVEAEYSGAPVVLSDFTLSLEPGTGVWQLASPGKLQQKYPVVSRFYGDDPDVVTETSDVVPSVLFNGTAKGLPRAIQGSYQDEYALTDQPMRGVSKVGRVQLWPEYDDLAVEVTIKDYDRWLPKGSIANPATPGNFLLAGATLVPKGGRVKDLPKVRNFRFELSDVSHEPGVCMNWPVLASDGDKPLNEDTAPDLSFAAENGAVLTNEKLTAEMRPTKDGEGRDSAGVRIGSYDFGGSAELRVVAVLEDGREITGILKNGAEEITSILLPYRRGNSRIAHIWRERFAVTGADSEDLDPEPVGDGNRGDGFSNYEEYRGFVIAREHHRTLPNQKTLFVQNRIGDKAVEGLHLFTDLTHLDVRYELKADEMPQSRCMNSNRSAKTPHTSHELQHGLILNQFKGTDASISDIEGDLWRPKYARMVYILARLLAPGEAANLASTIAHELLHAIGVHHHGELDDYVAWLQKEQLIDGKKDSWFEERSVKEIGGKLIVSGAPGKRIRIYGPDGREIPADMGILFAEPMIIFLGHYHQQHSGDVNCVMRYKVAEAFVLPDRPRDRFITPGEPPATGLCNSPVGTQFNASSPDQPIPRYDRASRGDCREEICVRDDAPDPTKKP